MDIIVKRHVAETIARLTWDEDCIDRGIAEILADESFEIGMFQCERCGYTLPTARVSVDGTGRLETLCVPCMTAA